MELSLLGLLAGTGWASGVNLYAVVALLGILGRSGVADLPAGLQRTDTIVVAGVLFALEFVADKIPWFDSLWDTVHTAIRPVGAAVLGAMLVGDVETWQQALAAIGSGGLAGASHVAKATTRAAINTSPEPASNVVASLLEDGVVATVVWLAVTNPVLALVVVGVLLVVGGVLTALLLRAARRAWRQRRSLRPAKRRTPDATADQE